jgi:hypothetical protein
MAVRPYLGDVARSQLLAGIAWRPSARHARGAGWRRKFCP